MQKLSNTKVGFRFELIIVRNPNILPSGLVTKRKNVNHLFVVNINNMSRDFAKIV